MRTLMNVVALFGLLASVALSASAAEMKKVLIFNYPGEAYKVSQAQQAVAALRETGFTENQQATITILQPQSAEEAAVRITLKNE